MTGANTVDPSMETPGAGPGDLMFCARRLSKVYAMGDVEVYALRSVDFDLYRGELVVLLGPSGSGKSTLLNILGGLDVPTHGSVRSYCRAPPTTPTTASPISSPV